MNPKLLIVDDDEEIRTQMKWALAKDYEVLLAEDRAERAGNFPRRAARRGAAGFGPAAASGQSRKKGWPSLSDLLALNRLVKVVIISGQGEKENALRAIGAGAYDFLSKPVEMEEVKFLLKRCFHVAQLEKEYAAMQQLMRRRFV